jgi:hypothetical protein
VEAPARRGRAHAPERLVKRVLERALLEATRIQLQVARDKTKGTIVERREASRAVPTTAMIKTGATRPIVRERERARARVREVHHARRNARLPIAYQSRSSLAGAARAVGTARGTTTDELPPPCRRTRDDGADDELPPPRHLTNDDGADVR